MTDGSAGSNPLLRMPIWCSLTLTTDLSLRAIIQVPPERINASYSRSYMNSPRQDVA